MSGVKLDRSDWTQIQYANGEPTVNTKGNLYVDESADAGGLHVRTHLGWSVTGNQVLVVGDTKAQNTAGGDSVVGYNDRTLNYTQINTIPGASLASNEITLPSGRFFVFVKVPYYANGTERFHFVNFTQTNDIVEIFGENHSTKDGLGWATCVGYLNTYSGGTYKVRHYTEAIVTNGLGVALNVTDRSEYYTKVSIQRIG